MSLNPEVSSQRDKGQSSWLRRKLLGMNRSTKRGILCLCDALVFSSCLWISMALRFGSLTFPRDERLDGLYFVLPIVGVGLYWFIGLYQSMLRSMESRTIVVIAFGAVVTAMLLPAWSFFDQKMLVPRTVPFAYALFVILGVGSIRLVLREVYKSMSNRAVNAQKVIVYGAGVVGTQLAAFLDNSPEYRVVAFVDDNPKLEGAKVRGYRIFQPKRLKDLQDRYGFSQIILAMNDISVSRQRSIVQNLAGLDIPIKTVPRITDMFKTDQEIAKLKPIRIEDLLGRQAVSPIESLLEDGLADKTILVTGAAGSIGSEICRQILKYDPKTIIAYDVSEFGLYSFDREVASLAKSAGIELVIKLGSVLNRDYLRSVMNDYNVDIVYHAAAYKHVPIVEDNVLIALENNSFGTQIVAEEAIAAKAERFILISTDKAVRPTSVMGASKRVAELVIQDLHGRSGQTVLSMVRFGNVLGSSGSVIPLFREQIAKGGPVTLTHKEVTRYFMTISEAAQLVLQASLLSSGGEVFVLDMGEPVKLHDLAKLMIQLSGNTPLDEGQQGEGIQIVDIGLRPGEKLYEELLIGDNVTGTKHPKIMRAMETKLSANELKALLKSFRSFIEKSDVDAAVKKLEESVALKPDSK